MFGVGGFELDGDFKVGFNVDALKYLAEGPLVYFS
jgi:hypothetical protein